MISKQLMKILILCFWVNIVFFPSFFTYSIISFVMMGNGITMESNPIIAGITLLFDFPFLFLSIYTVYFFYKYDRYSKSGIYLLLFNFIYVHIYFYRVIWKRKRKLANTFKHEAVLGNKIFIETEDFENYN